MVSCGGTLLWNPATQDYIHTLSVLSPLAGASEKKDGVYVHFSLFKFAPGYWTCAYKQKVLHLPSVDFAHSHPIITYRYITNWKILQARLI